MRYTITIQGELNVLHVTDHNIFFGWDNSDDYIDFRNALEKKGVDAFVDLLIDNPNTAFTIFCNGE